jgi:Cu/Ag efflux protein CusF
MTRRELRDCFEYSSLGWCGALCAAWDVQGDRKGITLMRDNTALQIRRFFSRILIAAGILYLAGVAGCGSPKPAEQPAQGPRRYHLEGRVVSVETAKQQLVVDHGDIPGFMSAMQMGYSVKDPNLLKPLSPEDQIKADVVVNDNDVYLENIVVTKPASSGKAPAASSSQPPPSQPAK